MRETIVEVLQDDHVDVELRKDDGSHACERRRSPVLAANRSCSLPSHAVSPSGSEKVSNEHEHENAYHDGNYSPHAPVRAHERRCHKGRRHKAQRET